MSDNENCFYSDAEWEKKQEEYKKLKREMLNLLTKNGYGVIFSSIWRIEK